MRHKRKKRRRLNSTRCKNKTVTIYNFTNLEIVSFVPLKEEQLAKISTQIENIIKSSGDKPSTEVAKKIIVQMKQCVSSAQYNFETLCFTVYINEKYLD